MLLSHWRQKLNVSKTLYHKRSHLKKILILITIEINLIECNNALWDVAEQKKKDIPLKYHLQSALEFTHFNQCALYNMTCNHKPSLLQFSVCCRLISSQKSFSWSRRHKKSNRQKDSILPSGPLISQPQITQRIGNQESCSVFPLAAALSVQAYDILILLTRVMVYIIMSVYHRGDNSVKRSFKTS